MLYCTASLRRCGVVSAVEMQRPVTSRAEAGKDPCNVSDSLCDWSAAGRHCKVQINKQQISH